VPGNFKARPTTDFAKENIFNVIRNNLDLEGAIALDLFAGTGSISFELISRGCAEVTCVEYDYTHLAFIKKVESELKSGALKPVKSNVFSFLEHCRERYDFIFADPPYLLKELETIPLLILSKGILNPDGLFIMEHPKEYDFAALPGFRERRVYGAVNFSLFFAI